MATGWARDGAVQDQIDASVEDAVRRSRDLLPAGPGRLRCEDCDAEIPAERRAALPGVSRCVACQQAHDAADSRAVAAYNRRGSKDSQLR